MSMRDVDGFTEQIDDAVYDQPELYHRLTIEVMVMGGSEFEVSQATLAFGESLLGTVIHTNSGDPIVITQFINRDVSDGQTS